MLQDFTTTTRREASSCVLETERLTLRKPTLADVKAIARLANDRRIAENTRRLPHPYTQDDAIAFVRRLVGGDWRKETAAELGYWLGVDHWGQGFGTEAARAVIDYFFEEFDLDQLI